MKNDTIDKILEFIHERKQVAAKDIINHFGLTKQTIFRHLARLLEQGKVYKIGKVPKVFYAISEEKADEKEYTIKPENKKVIEENFLTITPGGEMKKGWEGFVLWCTKRGQNVEKSALDYVSIIKKYNAIKKDGLLDGMKKMKTTFSKVYLDHIFYLDFYAIEHFGKTKLGQTLLYAKQSQNRTMIKDLTEEIKPKISKLITKYRIDAVAFIPPTVKREVQFMKELENNLKLEVNRVEINKIKTPVIVPQKTLNKLEDRIENAKRTFVFSVSHRSYKNLLLIDDAVGSGATLNEIALQARATGLAKDKIIGLVITGSLKGFDVISEV